MKKILLLSLIFLCFIVTLNAGQDWEDKEFLGTTTFQKQVTVNSNIVSSGVITATSGLSTSYGVYASTGEFTGSSFSVGVSTFVVINGDVGIGTTAPTSKLEIKDGILKIKNSAGDIKWNLNPDGISYFNNISSDARFGIGRSNPDYKLHVQGADIGLTHGVAGTTGLGLNILNTTSGGQIHVRMRRYADYDWKLIGKSAEFQINDNQSGTIPFRIEKGTPDNTIYLDSTGYVGIGTIAPSLKLDVLGDIKASYGIFASSANFSGNIVSTGTLYSGADLDISGAGTRLIWYPKKAAFRAGRVSDDRWDEVNIGIDTISMGYNSKATGEYAVALGMYAYATGRKSLAFEEATASGTSSIAIGDECEASGSRAITFGGSDNTASGIQSMTINGTNNDASGISATIINAENSIAEANYSTIFGKYMYLTDTSTNTFVYGFASSTQAITSPNSFLLFPYGETGKVGIGLKDPGATLHLNGTYADTASATQILYSTDTISVDSSYVNVVSTGGAVAVVGISTTTVVGGQIIEIWGTNDTDTIQIDSSATVALNSGVSYVLKKGYNISFRYIESIGKWCERSNRNDNVI